MKTGFHLLMAERLYMEGFETCSERLGCATDDSVV